MYCHVGCFNQAYEGCSKSKVCLPFYLTWTALILMKFGRNIIPQSVVTLSKNQNCIKKSKKSHHNVGFGLLLTCLVLSPPNTETQQANF